MKKLHFFYVTTHVVPLKVLFMGVCLSLMSMAGCVDSPSTDPLVETPPPCNLNEEFVRDVSEEQGRIHFDSTNNRYSVIVVKEGTYDSMDVGIICNMTDELKTPGIKITFNGRYYKYSKKIDLYYPGQSYYNLELSKYKIITTE